MVFLVYLNWGSFTKEIPFFSISVPPLLFLGYPQLFFSWNFTIQVFMGYTPKFITCELLFLRALPKLLIIDWIFEHCDLLFFRTVTTIVITFKAVSLFIILQFSLFLSVRFQDRYHNFYYHSSRFIVYYSTVFVISINANDHPKDRNSERWKLLFF